MQLIQREQIRYLDRRWLLTRCSSSNSNQKGYKFIQRSTVEPLPIFIPYTYVIYDRRMWSFPISNLINKSRSLNICAKRS